MNTIDIVGIGLTEDDLTRGGMALLGGGAKVILHTGYVGASDWLRQNGIAFETLDSLYEEADDFDEHAEAASGAVLRAAEKAPVVYGVIDLRDESVSRLVKAAPEAVRLHPGVPVDGALGAYCTGGLFSACASDYERFALRADHAALIREIDSAQLAGEVKLKLMDVYPDESAVYTLSGGAIRRISLEDLDRTGGYDHRFCALVLPCGHLTEQERFGFDDLMRLVEILRNRDGCPWDSVQTHESFKPLLIEEAYEVADAIDRDDPFDLADELGDVLFEVASHADIARRADEFDITDVTTAICRKMIRRHPRIFGGEGQSGGAEQWTRLKMDEKQMTSFTEWLRGVSRSLPSTLRAMKVIKRLEEAGISQEGEAALLQRLNRSHETLAAGGDAIGEALCALSALARLKGIDPELALNHITDEMIERFERAEANSMWEQLSAEERLARWDEAGRM